MGRHGIPLAFAAACALLGCGGGARPGGTAAATALSYAGPTDTTQWRLVANPSSTASHLVLDLLAPDGASGMGVTLVLAVDPARAAWSGAGPVDGGTYAAPLARWSSLRGGELRILLSQENPTPPVAYAGPVLSVALDLAPGAAPGQAALATSQGGHLAAPLTVPVPVTILAGALTAR